MGGDTLVTTGPNRVTRNPMYVGMAGLLLAHAIRLRSPAAVLPVAGFIAVIDRFQIPAEEAALHKLFPEAYELYVQATPRWLMRH